MFLLLFIIDNLCKTFILTEKLTSKGNFMIVKNCYAYSGFFGINGDTQIIGMTIDNALKVLESEKDNILNFADYDGTFSEKSANRYTYLNRLIKELNYDKRMSK